MFNLHVDDRNHIIALLENVPEMAREQDRPVLLELAGLKSRIPMIDFSGPRFVAAAAIVRDLESYGRPMPEAEALGMFLNTLKPRVGKEQQLTIDRILHDYDLMTPITIEELPSDWRGMDTPSSVTESIIGENTLRPIAFISRGLQLARAVAFVRTGLAGRLWSGTGFLVGPDLLLTNHHVLPEPACLAQAIFRFNYEDDFFGKAQPVREFTPRVGGIYHANAVPDYALVQLEGEPGREWGWISLIPGRIARDERANIIQHPGGRPKEISIQNNFVAYVGAEVVQYVTSTEKGSSGSPVFNDGWELVALHRAGGMLPEPETGRRYFRNEGVRIDRILEDLPAELRTLVKTAAAR